MEDKEKSNKINLKGIFKREDSINNQLQIVIDLMFLIAWNNFLKETDFQLDYKFYQVPLVFNYMHHEILLSKNLGFILLFLTPSLHTPVKSN